VKDRFDQVFAAVKWMIITGVILNVIWIALFAYWISK